MPRRRPKSKSTKTKYNQITQGVHYMTLFTLLIANLSILTIGMIFASTLGASLGDLENIAIRSRIQNSFARTLQLAQEKSNTETTPLLIISLGEDTRARLLQADPENIQLSGSFDIGVRDDVFELNSFEYQLEYSSATSSNTIETFRGSR